MFCIAISEKGKEFFYKKSTVIKCNSNKQAITLCEHMNKNNDSSVGDFKAKPNEIWYVHKDIEPLYRIKTTSGKITLTCI